MAFRLDKLTVKSQEAVQAAQSLAAEKGHPEIDPLHLLAAMLAGRRRRRPAGAGENRRQCGAARQADRRGAGPQASISGGSQPQPNRQLHGGAGSGAQEAAAMKDEFVSVEHLLLALTKIDSPAKNLLQVNGVRDKDILEALQSGARQRPRDRSEPRRTSIRPWKNTASTWSRRPRPASSIRSSAATTKSAA